MKIRVFIYILFLLTTESLPAQPGDSQYSVVIYDYNNWGFIDCSINTDTYQVFACNIEYISNDFLQTSWYPDFKTLEVTDTLICHINTDTIFPFQAFYVGKSYLNTGMLLVVKNGIDTMFVDGAGEHLMSDYYGTQNNLMAVIPFDKGLTKLFELQKEDNYRRLQNMTYRTFWTTSNFNIPVYNPWVKRISSFNLNKEKFYQLHDTLTIEITGSVTSDGSCADGAVLWILQKNEGNSWLSIKERMIQMDCGRGRNTFENKQLHLFIITEKINTEMFSFPMQIELDSGTYRLVIFDDIGLPYFSEIFQM
jgi:hypothetical protein